ncbi:hypothetical protein A2U01_0054003, partial [Trifolium medium]|nr:hypothetical protein [Trifolium medium]
VYSFLNQDGISLHFPIRDAIGGLTNGGTVTYAFLFLARLLEKINTLTIKQIVQEGKWRGIFLILEKLRQFGLGGLYFQQLKEKINEEREKVEQLAEEEAESEFIV